MDTQLNINAIYLIQNSDFSEYCDIDVAVRIVEK